MPEITAVQAITTPTCVVFFPISGGLQLEGYFIIVGATFVGRPLVGHDDRTDFGMSHCRGSLEDSGGGILYVLIGRKELIVIRSLIENGDAYMVVKPQEEVR
jgi:hypothetical protein